MKFTFEKEKDNKPPSSDIHINNESDFQTSV